jgi:acetate kinase
MNVLVLNAGSSNLKYQVLSGAERLRRGLVDHVENVHAAVEQILTGLDVDIHAVGHRVVHGGELFSESVLITDQVLDGIRQCAELAPLHNTINIECILACRNLLGPDLPQVAVFDTAFHHVIPERAFLYAVPYDWYRKHRVRRYGFHGTSNRYIVERYQALTGLSHEQTNIITLHLGNGCSATAIKNGRSIDTSMGLTPLEGLVMGTRSGDIDPGILGLISKKENLSLAEIESVLNHNSGLLGLSEHSNDIRELDPQSTAIEVFCYRAKKYVGSYLAAMSGADAIVFTGGIGEHAAAIRARICEGMNWAGLHIDPQRNHETVAKEGKLSTDDSKLAAYCIPTDEELVIARDSERVVNRERLLLE